MKMEAEEILNELGVDLYSDLGESFFEALDGRGSEVKQLNDWFTHNGFSMRVTDMVCQNDDGETTWEVDYSTVQLSKC